MTKAEIKTFIKRLQTVQNMTETSGVKELCEIIMDILDDAPGGVQFGFRKEEDEKADNNRRSS